MRVVPWIIVMTVGCAKPNALDALRREAITIAASNQPKLDELVARTTALKRDVRGNLPGWEAMWRIAELANDELGLPPFAQTAPPGPSWRPSPATLLGMSSYVRDQAAALAQRGQEHELQYLVDDERGRYAQGIANVDKHLAQVESWLRLARERPP